MTADVIPGAARPPDGVARAMAGRIRVGTSGWHYKHWVGRFYPAGTRSDAFLAAYAKHFSTAEINATFYRLPEPSVFARWRDATPPAFVFSCKASRYITHMKKLKDPRASLRQFLERIPALAEKLGPILFQLPPRWRVDVGRLTEFLDVLPAGQRAAFEFRDASWFTDSVYAALAQHNAALCAYDLEGRASPRERTADFAYVRLHGPTKSYRGSYGNKTLETWADRLGTWADAGCDAFCYFNNDEEGHAANDARRLIDRLGVAKAGGMLVTPRPYGQDG